MTASSERTPMRAIGELDPTIMEERAQLLLQAAAYMTPACWQAERDVAQTKWFDYRFLSPVEATLKFVEEYQRAYRIQWSRNFETAVAADKRGIASGELWHDRQEFSTFWNARVHADTLGMGYFIYCYTNMETAVRRAKQTRLLRPGQMRTADCIKAVKERWEEELVGARWLSELPHYRTENFCGLPDQLAHQQHVARTTRKRSSPVLALGASIDMMRVLPAHVAEEFFGEEHVTMARERAIGGPDPVEHVPDEQLIPSCFGLPAPLEVNAGPCLKCPLAAQCVRESERTCAAVVARYGSDDPHRAHVRELGRERVRRFREKQRLARVGAGEEAGNLDEAA
ncbi:hypothetical protein [Methylobacterium sp. WSM2598]|uniref:hypothetical protein n=1 Tax=Methylobacterium sp. WSM2598 TaxID=398261 RepID=UPI0012F6EF75|nr:hypothetical protein [Methylobacterium sp. WSM2598]